MIFSDKNMKDAAQNSHSSKRKVAGVIVAHGHLADELLAAAEMVTGTITHISAVSIGWHDDVDTAREELERATANASQGGGVLLLTDMFGGRPMDFASMLIAEGEVEVVTGVNLPMVIKLASQREEASLAEVARAVRDAGKEAIHVAGEILTRKES